MTKKILVLLLSIAMLCGIVACGKITGPGGGDDITTTKPSQTGKYSNVLAELGDLPNYGTNSYANADPIKYSNYGTELKDLSDKILDTQEDNTSEAGNYLWDEADYDDSVSTVTRIFCYANAQEIIDYMALASVDQDKMSACVEYIARDDADTEYNLVVGVGSAIQDYNEYDELYTAYEDDEDPDTYDLLQLKKRKIIAEVTTIFGGEGAQFARAAIQELAYAQTIVVDVMMPLEDAYKNNTISNDDYKEYFKNELFDYDTLVYFLSYNEKTGFNPTDSDRSISEKNEMTELFGYYYHYEKNDYEVFPRDEDGNDTEYKEYLRLSHLTTLSEKDALAYNEMQMRSYEEGYRYSYDFYDIYYSLHFDFQEVQEKYDREIFVGGSNATTFGYAKTDYNFSDGIGYALGNKTTEYSTEMELGLNAGMNSTLMLSDANWVYTSNTVNVKTMNERNTAWNKLSETEQNANKNKIYQVLLEREQLIAQHFAMTFDTTALKITTDREKKVNNANLDEALQYQIYNASADYIRAIQSFKKEDVLLQAEYDRMVARGASDEELADKQEEIGRNIALYMNMGENYSDSAFAEQLGYNNNWDAIKVDITDGISTEKDYQSYSDAHSGTKGDKQVDEYFEDKLIKKTVTGGDEHGVGSEEKYDTDHDLSRLISNHQATIYHMYGIINVEYKEAKYSKREYDIEDIGEIKANSTTEFVKSDTYENAMYSDDPYKGYGELSANNVIVNSYTSNTFKSEEFDTDEEITLATWESNKWNGTYIGDTDKGDVKTFTVTQKNKAGAIQGEYTYYLEFIGWYIDKANLYPAEADTTYDYDIRLYAGYRVTIIKNK